MSFEKTIIGEIEKCYAVSGLVIDGKPVLIYAGEGNGSIHIFRGENFSEHQVLTEGNGGTMSIVPYVEEEGWFFVSRGFYSMVDSKDSVIELVRYKDGRFEQPVAVAELAYLHRFGIVEAATGKKYVVAASLHSFKENKEDWSHPGHVYYAELPQDLQENFKLELTRLPGEYYMNHGLCTGTISGQATAFTTSKEGVFAWFPPAVERDEWKCKQLLDFPVSDIAVQDIDGDGEEELAVLLPFHGDQCKIYHKAENGYAEMYASPEENDFYHAIISAKIGGKNVFIGGARKGVMDLFILSYDTVRGGVSLRQVDVGVGPSNVAALNLPNQDLILSANRMIFEAAYYSEVESNA